MLRTARISLLMITIWTVVTGFFYPLAVTGLAQTFFPFEANGSIVVNELERPVGSGLLGQSFDDPAYFHGRPSATQPLPYSGAASAGSNLGPGSSVLAELVEKRVAQVRTTEMTGTRAVPIDLVTASGSGLDPDISIAGARFQIPRIARIRHIPEAEIERLLKARQVGRQLLVPGEPRVNVLLLNLALDKLK